MNSDRTQPDLQPAPHMKSTICVAEDRESCEPALKILLLSISTHSPEVPVNLFYPRAQQGFLDWVKRCAKVRLQTDPLAAGYGWNVKPQAILRLFNQGFEEVIWIDSDVVVKRNIVPLFSALGHDVLVAAEDALGHDRDDAGALRARLWRLPVGRVLPFGLNTGVIRVTKHHHRLVHTWWAMLQSPQYQHFQNIDWDLRPLHMLGDQDVLTALLSSAEFSQVPLHILRRGKDIVQFNGVYGYMVAERVKNLLGEGPAFVHQFGHKPWYDPWKASGLRDYVKKLYADLSPYTLAALRYRSQLQCDTEWMNPHYTLSRTLRSLGLGRPELAGLPFALLMEPARVVKSMRPSRRLEYSLSLLKSEGAEAEARPSPPPQAVNNRAVETEPALGAAEALASGRPFRESGS
jgi:hypothetical protein